VVEAREREWHEVLQGIGECRLPADNGGGGVGNGIRNGGGEGRDGEGRGACQSGMRYRQLLLRFGGSAFRLPFALPVPRPHHTILLFLFPATLLQTVGRGVLHGTLGKVVVIE
jgi:hypothetical protein